MHVFLLLMPLVQHGQWCLAVCQQGILYDKGISSCPFKAILSLLFIDGVAQRESILAKDPAHTVQLTIAELG